MKKNKHLRNLIIALSVVVAIVLIVGAIVLIDRMNSQVSDKISKDEAQTLLDDTLDSLPNYKGSKYIREHSKVTVQDIEYGLEKNIVLTCSYETIDVANTVRAHINDLLNISLKDPNTGMTKNATKIKQEIEPKMTSYLQDAKALSGEITIQIYETKQDGLKVYLSDEVVNTIFGGILTAHEEINQTKEIEVSGQSVDISNKNSLRRGCVDSISLVNYESEKPDTSSAIQRTWNNFKNEFYRNFIQESRWVYLVKGLGTTLAITALSLVLGVFIGFIVAIIRCTCAKTGKLKVLDKICAVYLSIMRGTPVMVQLMIIYFVILLPIGIEKFTAAVLCFGINSGAYVAEIVRGGIMSVDEGQTEAGRSLGLGYVATMCYIVVPQAFKAILPSLANEFIALLKETSVAFYIGVADLTQGGLKIRSITYSNFMPLLAIALVYLVLVLGLSYLVSLLERRLRKSDRN